MLLYSLPTPSPRVGGRRRVLSRAAAPLAAAALLAWSPLALAPLGAQARGPHPASVARDSLTREAALRDTLVGALLRRDDGRGAERSLAVQLPDAPGSAVLRRDTTAADSLAPYIELSTRGFAGVPLFRSAKDSLEWTSARATAERSGGFRLVVSLFERQLWVLEGDDTLRTAPIAVARGDSIEYDGRVWRFHTPRGVRTVLRKEANPVWVPPLWHYVEVAQEHGLKLDYLPRTRPVTLLDGSKLLIRDGAAVLRHADGRVEELPVDEEIVFDSTLYVPPVGSRNRQIVGELGRFRLDLGDGYLLHGTPYESTIGTRATHGCVRLRDEDIEWLYENVPKGTKVYIY